MTDKPNYWRVRIDEIKEQVDGVTRGEVTQIATSPAGNPVYAVAYGDKADFVSATNWSGASGAGDPTCFKKEEGEKQVIALVAGCHGAEAEATAGATNIIQLMETGKDYLGRENDEFLKLAENYRLIVIPSLNPDGRDASPDHLVGVEGEEFQKLSQGTWSDGSCVGYPTCKKFQPLPLERIGSLGGYPNSAGYNIMHDATPGDIRTDEAKGLLKLMDDEKVDLALHMHSHGTPPDILPPSAGVFDLHRQRILAYRKRMMSWFGGKGIECKQYPEVDPAATWLCPVNLTTMTTLASGALSPVFEQPTDGVSFETMVDTVFEISAMFMHYGLDEAFSPRLELLRSFYDAGADLVTYD